MCLCLLWQLCALSSSNQIGRWSGARSSLVALLACGENGTRPCCRKGARATRRKYRSTVNCRWCWVFFLYQTHRLVWCTSYLLLFVRIASCNLGDRQCGNDVLMLHWTSTCSEDVVQTLPCIVCTEWTFYKPGYSFRGSVHLLVKLLFSSFWVSMQPALKESPVGVTQAL